MPGRERTTTGDNNLAYRRARTRKRTTGVNRDRIARRKVVHRDQVATVIRVLAEKVLLPVSFRDPPRFHRRVPGNAGRQLRFLADEHLNSGYSETLVYTEIDWTTQGDHPSRIGT